MWVFHREAKSTMVERIPGMCRSQAEVIRQADRQDTTATNMLLTGSKLSLELPRLNNILIFEQPGGRMGQRGRKSSSYNPDIFPNEEVPKLQPAD